MSDSAEPELVLDGSGPVPQQIEAQVRQLILSGALRPGDQLPTVRTLAVELTISPHAVEQAYNRLENEGFVDQREGSGPYVAVLPSQTVDSHLLLLCRDFLGRAAEGGYSVAQVLHALHICAEEGVRHE